MTSPIQKVIDAMAKLETQIIEIGSEIILGQANQVFAARPDIRAIGWRLGLQQNGIEGPYFLVDEEYVYEDGEFFKADDVGRQEPMGYIEDVMLDTWDLAYTAYPESREQRTAMEAQLNVDFAPVAEIPEEIMYKIFDYNQRVIVLRDGSIDVSEDE